MRRTRAVVAAIALMTLAGCGNGSGGGYGSGDSPSATASEEATSPSPTPTGDTAMAGAATVKVATTSLGGVLVDADGMTLYMFDPDAQGASTCSGDCAVAWPPLLTDGTPAVGDGADDSKIGTVNRDDGSMQVTYDKWPLYYFAQDSAPGDVKGQSLNGKWWVLDADGQPIRG